MNRQKTVLCVVGDAQQASPEIGDAMLTVQPTAVAAPGTAALFPPSPQSENTVPMERQRAQAAIGTAWQAYQKTEEYGLDFGRVCCEWRTKFGAQGKRVKGQGVIPILEELGIATSTAYFWMVRYEESVGIRKDTLTGLHACLNCGEELRRGKQCNACGGLYRKRTFDELPKETAEKEVLKSAEYFLQQTASIPDNIREELQSRNLLTPDMDAKLTRVEQAAKQTNQPTAVITDAINFPKEPTQLQAEFYQLKALFNGTDASLQCSERGYAIVGLTATQIKKIAKLLLRAVEVNALHTQLTKASNAN